MVDVAHHRDHGGTRQFHGFGGGFLFFQERLGVVKLGGQRLVTHLLHDDHRGFLVQLLVDGDHLAELHHLLDDFSRLHAHLVRQIGHADGFGHMNFLHHGLNRRHAGRRLITVASAATPLGRTPAGARTGGGVPTGLERALLGRVVCPARGQLFALDGLLLAWLGGRGGTGAWRPGLGSGLVDGALDGGFGGLGLLGLLGHEHLLGRAHHRADGSGLRLGSLAALFQISHALTFSRIGIDGLDHAGSRFDRRLGRCGCGSRHFGASQRLCASRS